MAQSCPFVVLKLNCVPRYNQTRRRDRCEGFREDFCAVCCYNQRSKEVKDVAKTQYIFAVDYSDEFYWPNTNMHNHSNEQRGICGCQWKRKREANV